MIFNTSRNQFIFLILASLSSLFCLWFSDPQANAINWMLPWIFYCLVGILCVGFVKHCPNAKGLLLLGLLFRIPFLFYQASDDINRYIYEAEAISKGINPYQKSPEIISNMDFKSSIKKETINHPDQTACYPPGVMISFALLTKISSSKLFFKWIFLAFDLLIILSLYLLLQVLGLPKKLVFLYLFHPLPALSFAAHGHLDSILLALLLLSVLAHLKKKPIASALYLALSIQAKYISILALPFLMKKTPKFWIPFLMVLSLPFFYFLEPSGAFFQSLHNFSTYMAWGNPIRQLIKPFLGDDLSSGNKLFFMLFFLGYGALLYKYFFAKKRMFLTESLFFTILLLLCFSSTVHQWYFCWIFPFSILAYKKSGYFAACTCGLYLLTFDYLNQTQIWHLPQWIQWIIWFPMLMSLGNFIKSLKRSYEPTAISKVSIIIPTLNDNESLKPLLINLKRVALVDEVIVVDGGSKNSPEKMCIEHETTFMDGSSVTGRGNQYALGMEKAKGDLLLLLHADHTISEDLVSKIKTALKLNPQFIGGACGVHFDKSNTFLRLLGFLNFSRAFFTNVSFGDQIQFVRKDLALKHNLINKIPLMEDVEFSLCAHRIGPLIFLMDDNNIVSSRAWQNKPVRRFIKIAALYLHYRILRSINKADTHLFYEKYYGKKQLENK
jgi:GT2 family glycosyltransferase